MDFLRFLNLKNAHYPSVDIKFFMDFANIFQENGIKHLFMYVISIQFVMEITV